jgi:hypothetical protein
VISPSLLGAFCLLLPSVVAKIGRQDRVSLGAQLEVFRVPLAYGVAVSRCTNAEPNGAVTVPKSSENSFLSGHGFVL